MFAMEWRVVARGIAALVIVPAIAWGAAPDLKRSGKEPGSSPGRTRGPFQAQTTLNDFYQGGSQPNANSYEQILHSQTCGVCHGGDDDSILINKPWAGSMHGLQARDPLMYACMAIAEQDAAYVGDMCIRCHVPRAWMMERGIPTDGSLINTSDRDGNNCHFCHRMVDPVYQPGECPDEDGVILEHIALPVTNDNASYILDPLDRRRSTRGTPSMHTYLQSPFFNDSRLCETCHDASNPTLDRQPDDTFIGNALDEPHPTGNKYDMFPLERTFSEWLVSDYATTGVDAGGRFGGNLQVVSTCQDCHMPDTTGAAADIGPVRDDMADHGMYGGATWIPLVVELLYPDEVDPQAIQMSVAGSRSMLERAASLETTQAGDTVNVRVINETGHRLPTGQAEGRLMWVNVQFFNGDGQMIAERGAYDSETATPATDDTKVYEIVLGIDEATAEAVGLSVGPTHHVAFCNVIYKDNRIPPRGFLNEPYRQMGCFVVGVTYNDGQYWDDTQFMLPRETAQVAVAVYYKTATTEFIEFLRDANYTNDAGQVLYDAWAATGKSPPVLMVSQTLEVAPFDTGDFDGNGQIDLVDYGSFPGCMTGPDVGPVPPQCAPGDLDADGDVDLLDFGRFQRRFGT